jgi:hydroxyethylthiazole kinase-like uncharacterized protein yjeF
MLRRALWATMAPIAAAFTYPVLLGSRRGVSALSASDFVPSVPLPSLFVNSSVAREIDEVLMSSPGFSIDQLMELAGLSVANAVHSFAQGISERKEATQTKRKKVLLVCGPGNNGGDGLVAARHLHHFGYAPTIVYPKQGKTALFTNLVKQCEDLGIEFVSEEQVGDDLMGQFSLIVDAVFGFSFKGEVREPFRTLLTKMASSGVATLSVDIPSGWDVNDGDVNKTGFTPQAVISLTVPKQCMQGYTGQHYVGGRFIPPAVQARFALELPDYGKSPAQIAKYEGQACAKR